MRWMGCGISMHMVIKGVKLKGGEGLLMKVAGVLLLLLMARRCDLRFRLGDTPHCHRKLPRQGAPSWNQCKGKAAV